MAVLVAVPAWGGTPLLEQYHRLKNGHLTTLPGTSISLASTERDGAVSAEVITILPYPFTTLAPALAKGENWCQFMPLHFNIKACTYALHQGSEWLTLYSGRKTYQTPKESYALVYRFEVAHQDAGELSLHLHADSGPAGTRDYEMVVDALKVTEGTLLHIRSSYRPSFTSSLLTSAYLSTSGRDKIGFTLIAKAGKAQPVQGLRGVIERNVMRYYLAIDTFLNTQSLPDASRHTSALQMWFKLNDSYPRQLHEMSEQEYLEIKQREWVNQQQLQRTLNQRQDQAAPHRLGAAGQGFESSPPTLARLPVLP
ncbi:MAG TPA: hypothetical protein VGE50_00045 [Gammaproteobacteria bacterium]